MDSVSAIVSGFIASRTAKLQLRAASGLLDVAAQTGSRGAFDAVRKLVAAADQQAAIAADSLLGLAESVDVYG